jgi:AraC-like DNA-binding protein
VIAQYEADIDDPARTRFGTSLADLRGPLPRFLPVRDILRINFNMHAMVPTEAVPQRLARSSRIPTDDNLALALPYAPTLRAALDLVARYGDAVVPWYWRSVTPVGGELHIRYGPIVPLGRIEPLATEIALATIHRIIEMFIGDRISAATVNFAAPTASSPSMLASRFACHLRFGGDTCFIAIPADWGSAVSPYHDPQLWLEGVARCEADIRVLADLPLIGRVRGHIAARLDAGHGAAIADTAQALGLSSRSLVRALSQRGFTHHQLVDQERRERTRQLLTERSLPLADIVERLGFADQSAFGRKCQAWFGDSPARLRRQWTPPPMQ